MKIQAVYHTERTQPNRIARYMHCQKCLEEKPNGFSPQEWSRTQIGITEDGHFQVWCTRHNINVARIELKIADAPASVDIPPCPHCAELEWVPGTLVYIKEDLNENGVTPPGVGRVIEDLGDTVLVQPLDPLAFIEHDKQVDMGEEEEIVREYLQKIEPGPQPVPGDDRLD